MKQFLPLAIAICTLVAPSASAQYQPILPNGRPTYDVPRMDEVDVEEQLGGQLPADAVFRDHTGKQVRLGDYFDGERPVVLTFAYHTCPTLCSLVLDAAWRGLATQDWTAGQEFQVITISIDPEETLAASAAKREEVLTKYRTGEGAVLTEIENGSGLDLGSRNEATARNAIVTNRTNIEWHFLTGDAEAIEAVTDAAGYRYFHDTRQEQYAHAAAIMFLTPEGKLARYLYGLRLEHNDVRLGLLEASEGRSITSGERFLLYCYAYDPQASGYVLVAKNIMKLGGALTVLIVGGFLVFFWRRERRRRFDDRTEPRTGLKPTQVEA